MANQLSKLVRKADAVSNAASVLVSSTIREVRGKLYDLSDRTNLAGSADDREYAYDIIRRTWARLSRRLNALMDAQNQLAARGAAKDAGQMTGLEIKYSAARANAILELVTPAQGENLAAVFTQRMSKRMIDTLRESTVSALREQAVAGGTVKELSREMATRWAEALKTEDPKFVDSAGHVWDTKRYFQMNARTNTMRVYNDCLVDNVARETGSDLMRISTGGDPDCDCFAWEGCIVSVSGKTKGFPTYEDARRGGCFHPNCTHTLEYVDEVADAEEIELQKAHPADPDNADDPTAQDDRRYEIDQARKMRDEGMTQDEARVAVDRDNLADAIRSGLVRSDAEELVRKMTDEQVTRLCPNGNPPAFVPAKGTKKHPEPEVWNHGKMGGVVHIRRGADLDTILKVCKVDKPLPPKAQTGNGGKGGNSVPVARPNNPPVKSTAPKQNAPQGVIVPEFKNAAEAEKFLKDKFDVSAIGLKIFSADQQRGIAEATRDAFENGCDKRFLRFVSTGQAMLKDAEAKKSYIEARKNASPSDISELFYYRMKGVRKGLKGEDAEWYGICQQLKATGRTVAHCISWKSNALLQMFNGIYFNPKSIIEDGSANVSNGWWAPGGGTVKGTMAHELGHAIDKSLSKNGLRFCEQPGVRAIWKGGGIEQGLSKYGSTAITEMIAEAWCEYTTQKNPRDIAKKIGDLVKSEPQKRKTNATST